MISQEADIDEPRCLLMQRRGELWPGDDGADSGDRPWEEVAGAICFDGGVGYPADLKASWEDAQN